jgi:hypothetical protein
MDLDIDNDVYQPKFSFFSLFKYLLLIIILLLIFAFIKRSDIIQLIKSHFNIPGTRTVTNNLESDVNYPQPTSDSEPAPSSNKKGWCFVGKNKDVTNVCAFVGVNDTCMSGNIFPTKDLCINPKLRS